MKTILTLSVLLALTFGASTVHPTGPTKLGPGIPCTLIPPNEPGSCHVNK
ncbi:MAG: hypothetical protein WBQ94_03730 [Terracidiphilus sp.]